MRQTLENAGFDGTAWSMQFIIDQLFLRQGEGFLTDQSRNRNFNPFLAWQLMVRAITRCQTAAQTQRSGNALTCRYRRFAKAGTALIGRIAQYRPDDRAFPAGLLFPRVGKPDSVNWRVIAPILSPSTVYQLLTLRTTSASVSTIS